MARIRLNPLDELHTVSGAGGATQTTVAVYTDIIGDFDSSLELTAIGGTSPQYTVTIQGSPDPEDIADNVATWYNIQAFALTAVNTTEEIKVTGQHFSRMRLSILIAGTDPTALLHVIIEGQQISELEGMS